MDFIPFNHGLKKLLKSMQEYVTKLFFIYDCSDLTNLPKKGECVWYKKFV